jgi:hypothetical protein
MLTKKEAFCIRARVPLYFFLLNLQLNTFKKQLLKRGPFINRFTLYEDDDTKKWRERHGCDESGKREDPSVYPLLKRRMATCPR